ncbi:hypothetical protein P43SY_007638 [Pythium insidiosum]|uniref:Uncharacterized protein n=1 Tax=Pythium insidiosum TaxID=114742 RepID=A0AAD5L959_PYTIN|nr:hypothetical protein P43SY_007638 [Pythium insidiosum]
MLDEAAAVAARDDGEVFPTHTIGYDVAPSRQPRLRLRPMKDAEYDAAASARGDARHAPATHTRRSPAAPTTATRRRDAVVKAAEREAAKIMANADAEGSSATFLAGKRAFDYQQKKIRLETSLPWRDWCRS